MYEYIEVTLRSREGKWNDIDIRAHAKQPWDHIMKVLMDNGIINEEQNINYNSLRLNKSFPGNLNSIEAGVYTGDIIEVGGC